MYTINNNSNNINPLVDTISNRSSCANHNTTSLILSVDNSHLSADINSNYLSNVTNAHMSSISVDNINYDTNNNKNKRV